MATAKKKFRALTHLSVHRDRHPQDAPGQTGADFVERGDPVELDAERAERLLKLGAVEPWDADDAAEKFPTARDMSGKAFPDQAGKSGGKASTAADPTGQPESNDPQPSDSQPKEESKGTPDPYAK